MKQPLIISKEFLIQAEEMMSLRYYQIECNFFLFTRILLECLLLLIGYELNQNHS